MGVTDISDESLSAELGANDRVVVKFYADWCGSCRLFNPKYKRLSNDDRFGSVKFLNINAENNPEARKLAGISNLPSFSIFEKGQLKETIFTSKEEAVVELLNKLN